MTRPFERMRRLRFCASLTSVLDAEFGPEAKARRRAANEAAAKRKAAEGQQKKTGEEEEERKP